MTTPTDGSFEKLFLSLCHFRFFFDGLEAAAEPA